MSGKCLRLARRRDVQRFDKFSELERHSQVAGDRQLTVHVSIECTDPLSQQVTQQVRGQM